MWKENEERNSTRWPHTPWNVCLHSRTTTVSRPLLTHRPGNTGYREERSAESEMKLCGAGGDDEEEEVMILRAHPDSRELVSWGMRGVGSRGSGENFIHDSVCENRSTLRFPCQTIILIVQTIHVRSTWCSPCLTRAGRLQKKECLCKQVRRSDCLSGDVCLVCSTLSHQPISSCRST